MLLKLLRHRLFYPIFSKRAMTTDSAAEYSACVTTVPNDDVARKLARSLVEARLAACVNIIPNVRSVYEWKSAIQEDNELILMMKTRREHVAQLIEFVKKNHPYEVPELIELPIHSGNPAYLNWIDEIVKHRSSS